MPFLPIDSTIITTPSRLHLAIIESWMLWPNDETKRLGAYTSAVVAFGQELKRKGKLDHSTLPELFDLAADATPLNQMAGLVEDPYRDGLMAGNILIVALAGGDEGNRRKLGDIYKKLRESFARQKGDNSSFVNSIWQKYRPVSHLWAAHIQITESDQRPVFPCELRDVIEFLWLSEEWRQRGETTKSAPKAPTILEPGECVRIPDTMKFSK
jgi:hypothetical protein